MTCLETVTVCVGTAGTAMRNSRVTAAFQATQSVVCTSLAGSQKQTADGYFAVFNLGEMNSNLTQLSVYFLLFQKLVCSAHLQKYDALCLYISDQSAAHLQLFGEEIL